MDRFVKDFLGQLGRMFFTFLQDLSSLTMLFKETVGQSASIVTDRKRFNQARVLQSVDEVGARSLPLILVVSLLLGTALTVLISFQLKELGALNYVPGLVSVAIFREMGPLITGLIVGGRVGAAYTARIGTMKVSEEILALETMAINPVRFLVVQRFIGLIVALPALTVLACFNAGLGAFLFGSVRLGIRPDSYLKQFLEVLSFTDIVSGTIKAVIFGAVIAMIGCYRGLVVDGSAEDVGKSTMVSVVWSTLAIIILDTVMTAAFYG